MAPFENIGLTAAKWAARQMARFTQLVLRITGGCKTVIAGHDHERVFRQLIFIQSGQYITDCGVRLHHEVGIITQTAFPLPLFRG